jgi:hypothetical protein
MTVIGTLALTTLSVFATGSLMDGQGGFFWTLLGTATGMAVGSLIAGPLQSEVDSPLFWPLMMGGFAVAGATLFYELSSSSRADAERARDRELPQIVGSVAPTDGGALLMVGGSLL